MRWAQPSRNREGLGRSVLLTCVVASNEWGRGGAQAFQSLIVSQSIDQIINYANSSSCFVRAPVSHAIVGGPLPHLSPKSISWAPSENSIIYIYIYIILEKEKRALRWTKTHHDGREQIIDWCLPICRRSTHVSINLATRNYWGIEGPNLKESVGV